MSKRQGLILAVFSIIILYGCDNKPYVEHKASLEKIANDCSGLQKSVKLVSNFGGERFEFQKCLPQNYDVKNILSRREGDDVFIDFNNSEEKTSLYHVTLDIDAYPGYKAIIIDGESVGISSDTK